MCALPKAEVKKKTVGVDIRSTSLMVTGGGEEVEVLGHLVSGRRGAQITWRQTPRIQLLDLAEPSGSSYILRKQLLSRCQKVKYIKGAALPITRASCCSIVKIPGKRPGSREVSLAQLLRKLPATCRSLQQCWACAPLCSGEQPSGELLSEPCRAATFSE